MAITPIQGNTATAPTQKQQAALDMSTFLRLLTVQLQTQDPLNPMNDRDFFAQMAQLGTVQGIGQLKDSLDVAQAAQLMGKTVTATSTNTENGVGGVVTGLVKKLTVQNGQYLLDLETADGGYAQVKMSSIQSISEGT